MELTADNLHRVLVQTMRPEAELDASESDMTERLKKGDVPDWAVVGDAIVAKILFDRARLETHRANVVSMLDQLDDAFKTSGGGGMSFLNMQANARGEQWGGQRDAGVLCAVGMALGVVKFTVPREMWDMLPGALPYVTYDDVSAHWEDEQCERG